MEFKKVKLKDVGEIVGGATPSTKNPHYYDGNISWITPKDLTGYNNIFIGKGERNISEDGFNSCSTKMLPKNTILFSSRAPIGYIAIAENELCTNQGFKSIVPNENIYYLFLYYLLKYKKDYIAQFGSGTTFKEISGNVMKEIEVEIPKNINDQKRIAEILYKIDKKIELNNQINDNLFELSCLNYREWYQKLNENEETTYSKLKQLGNIVMGQSPKGESYNFNKVGVPLINGAADYENGFLKAQKYTSMPTKICKKNDLIFCIRATIGLLVISDSEYCLGRGVAGITGIDEYYKEYAFHLIYNSIEEFKKLATGSVIVGISRNDIEDIKVKIPNMEQIQEFHKIQSPIFCKIENIRVENKILTQLRETLLPKLMNGEIDLDKIEI